MGGVELMPMEFMSMGIAADVMNCGVEAGGGMKLITGGALHQNPVHSCGDLIPHW
eukprot:CAMPEP_0197862130 /NCGR_PEP_ID=MMETSP1438-20131217/38657_1 /TAXON_ID=1461541 /ORGANISM="Pterosperma sp., Strain CCMP1384" /LENGTH=54 /DNA_ID=CAMNT_0043479575 /DNA_START=339 /DNA_END=499 /DNA_ORIENTATION=-